LVGKSVFDFFAAGLKGLGGFFVEFAHSSQREVNAENSLHNLLTATAGDPMQSSQVWQECGQSRSETGPCLSRNLSPRAGAALTFHAPQCVFGDLWLDLGNIHHLAAEIGTQDTAAAVVSGERFSTRLARLGEDLFNVVHLFNGHKISVRAFMTRLSPRIALSGLLASPGLRFLAWTVG
jgi:hypothetical protein